MSTIKKMIAGVIGLIALAIIGAVVLIVTFDANKYKPQLVEVLSKKTGRTVRLDGPITLGFSMQGFTLSIQDVALGNPPWASRKELAGIGHIDLGVALLPLLNKELVIKDLEVANADIQLETNTADKHNWDMAAPGDAEVETKPTEKSAGRTASIRVDDIAIKDSQLALRDKNGKKTVFKVTDMKVSKKGSDTVLDFTGEYNDIPLTLKLTSGTDDFARKEPVPVTVDMTYANYHITAKGKANFGAKTAAIEEYHIDAGSSKMHGGFEASWSGARPSVRGDLIGGRLEPADLKMKEVASSDKPAAKENPPAKASPAGAEWMFTTAPLPFDALKSVDASMDVTIEEVPLTAVTLSKIKGKLDLAGGRMNFPVKAVLGQSPIDGYVRLDAAASPAQLQTAFAAPNVNLSDLLSLGDVEKFITGKGNAELSITSSGNSMRAIASNADGHFNVIGAAGSVSGSLVDDISSGLMQLIAPGGGSNTMNCMAARFNITNGVMKDNGILMDTAATTVIGNGSINFQAETIAIVLNAKTKLVNIGSFLPALHVGGTLLHPSFGLDTESVVKKVTGLLTSGTVNTGVPDVTGIPGENACVYTLDHPTAQKQTVDGKVLLPPADRIKNIGNQLMKGIMGQ